MVCDVILIKAKIKIFKNETSNFKIFNAIIDKNLASLIESITAQSYSSFYIVSQLRHPRCLTII